MAACTTGRTGVHGGVPGVVGGCGVPGYGGMAGWVDHWWVPVVWVRVQYTTVAPLYPHCVTTVAPLYPHCVTTVASLTPTVPYCGLPDTHCTLLWPTVPLLVTTVAPLYHCW